jgi:hypothetical protein
MHKINNKICITKGNIDLNENFNMYAPPELKKKIA